MASDAVIPIDAHELAELTGALRLTSYHKHLEDYVRERIAHLQDDDVTDVYVAMKRRGQVEELQHLLRPAFCQTLALLGLRARVERDRRNTEAMEPPPERPWWVDPPGPEEEPIP